MVEHHPRQNDEIADARSLKLIDGVAGHEQAGYGDRLAQARVKDGHNRHVATGQGGEFGRRATQGRGEEGGRRQGDGLGRRRVGRRSDLFADGSPVIQEGAHHAQAVFVQLLAVIRLQRWHVAPGDEIPLVRRIDEADAEARLELRL